MKTEDLPDLLRGAIRGDKPLPTKRTANIMRNAALCIEALSKAINKQDAINRENLYRDVDINIAMKSAYFHCFAAISDLREVLSNQIKDES
jgi:hypothetical protein